MRAKHTPEYMRDKRLKAIEDKICSNCFGRGAADGKNTCSVCTAAKINEVFSKCKQVYIAYNWKNTGLACVNCDIEDAQLYELDHINNDGCFYKKKLYPDGETPCTDKCLITHSTALIRNLCRFNSEYGKFPHKDVYQTLCAACHRKKHAPGNNDKLIPPSWVSMTKYNLLQLEIEKLKQDLSSLQIATSIPLN